MDKKNTLNGFEAVLDSFIPNVGKTNENDDILLEDVVEELTDEELEALKGNAKPKKEEDEPTKEEEEDIEEDESVEEEDEVKQPKKKTKKETKVEPEVIEEEEEETTEEETETEIVTNFFDAMAEKMGWEFEEGEEKPKTAEELIDYFTDIIEENSVPQYASEEVQKLDEFVKNGGDIRDYFQIDAELDIDDISIEDNEVNQKLVIKELLKEKGFSNKQIEKKISKYEDAGLLEDEAEDALEALVEIKAAKKEQLLANQQKEAEEAKKRQQEFFSNVVTEIKGMNSIYGVAIPEKDKKELLDYIFKPDAEGKTRYQKDYAKSLKNLITSAYFTMKGDTLVEIAKKEGKKTAINNFKNSLSKNSGISKQSRKQIIKNDDSTLWSSLARQLRVA